jgi:hypothetical protein
MRSLYKAQLLGFIILFKVHVKLRGIMILLYHYCKISRANYPVFKMYISNTAAAALRER